MSKRTAVGGSSGCADCHGTGHMPVRLDNYGTHPVEFNPALGCPSCVVDSMKVPNDCRLAGPAWALETIGKIMKAAGVTVETAPRNPDGSVTVRCG